MSSTIIYRKTEGVAHITLNRPDSYNSVNQEMSFALLKALNQYDEDSSVRAAILTGKGKAFCAGQDLKEVIDSNKNPGFRNILEKHYNPLIQTLQELKKPIVAAVNGVAAGAGANIALACDIVIAAEKASFIQAFSDIGLIPDSGGTYFLPRLVGYQKAMALAMLGDKVTAQEAEQMGMIYKSIPTDEFEKTVETTAKRLAQMPTKGLRLTKEAFRKSLDNDLMSQLQVETELQIQASETNDYREGVNAFVEKRKPNFKGY